MALAVLVLTINEIGYYSLDRATSARDAALDGRVIVATFASNIARIQQVLDAAAEMNRSVAVIGRSMEQNFRIATDLGYLKFDASRMVAKDKIKDHPDGKLVIATTGAQGEPMAGLARMANHDHRFVEIQPGDTVIVSASPIPGNEEYVARTIDNLFKAGANVIYHAIRHAHVSGHASQEELKLMLNLTRPRFFIPMHGTLRHLVHHAQIAERLAPVAGLFGVRHAAMALLARFLRLRPVGHCAHEADIVGDATIELPQRLWQNLALFLGQRPDHFVQPGIDHLARFIQDCPALWGRGLCPFGKRLASGGNRPLGILQRGKIARRPGWRGWWRQNGPRRHPARRSRTRCRPTGWT